MDKELKKNEYKCAHCGNVYEYGWSEEEAKAEAESTFGKPVEEWVGGAAVICDDCYQKMNPAENPDAVQFAKEII